MVYLDNRATWEPDEAPHRVALVLADRLEAIRGFARQVKALRCCGLPMAGEGEGGRRLSCHLRFCPVCQPRWRRKALLEWGARIDVIKGSSGEVAAVTLTAPPAQGRTGARVKADLRSGLSRLFRKQAWKGTAGHIRRVGVLLAVEVGGVGEEGFRPHAHLLLVGSVPGHATRAAEWLIGAWLTLHPGSHRAAQDSSTCEGPEGFRRWLNYILKGDRLDPSWDDARLLEAAILLMDGSHRVRALGRLAPCRRPGRSVVPKVGSARVRWSGRKRLPR